MCDDNFLATRDCYIYLYRLTVALMLSQTINCAKCFLLTVNLQMRSDLLNSQCTEFTQISVVTMTTNLNVTRKCNYIYPIYKYNL